MPPASVVVVVVVVLVVLVVLMLILVLMWLKTFFCLRQSSSVKLIPKWRVFFTFVMSRLISIPSTNWKKKSSKSKSKMWLKSGGKVLEHFCFACYSIQCSTHICVHGCGMQIHTAVNSTICPSTPICFILVVNVSLVSNWTSFKHPQLLNISFRYDFRLFSQQMSQSALMRYYDWWRWQHWRPRLNAISHRKFAEKSIQLTLRHFREAMQKLFCNSLSKICLNSCQNNSLFVHCTFEQLNCWKKHMQKWWVW